MSHPFRILANDGVSENARGLCWDCAQTEREHRPLTLITQERSADVKSVLDVADGEVRRAIARQFPLEFDEWMEELERGDR